MRGRPAARYGASPLHLLLVLASFALTGYAGVRLLDGDTLGVALWFVGAAVLHDLVLLPLYAAVDRLAQAVAGRRGAAPGAGHGRELVNYVRVPVFLSLLLLLTWFPLILRQVDRFTASTTLPDDVFLGRWLLVTAGLFAVSALCLLLRLRRARTSRSADGARRGSSRGRPGPPGPPGRTGESRGPG